MASCDVHLEEGAAKVDSKIEIRTTKCGIVLQPTKIPGPVSLDNSGNFIFTSTRRYTSLMKSLQPKSDHDNSFSSTSTLVNTTEDSGVRMDCSTVDDDNYSCILPIVPQASQQSDSKEVFEQIHLAQSVTQVSARERKHVRVEDLLQAENDVELLHKLLQTDGELGTGESSDLAQDNNPVLATDSNDDKNVEDDDAESPPKRVNLVHSLLQIICGKGMRNLSYPILFCGMAVGLIYYFCKN